MKPADIEARMYRIQNDLLTARHNMRLLMDSVEGVELSHIEMALRDLYLVSDRLGKARELWQNRVMHHRTNESEYR